ncbi:hypothetical protein BLA24_15795 [Streptomyces cinnamoneus]|uniref:C2H2-type domain-containing protein n=1 Tax=Streptomyces cinnamoneus TaxID=53446 RepID=A0A2G1XJF9_STRCJ|nr:hypothetical protein BLA24_15795 [Streptomyces cinnamoneus]PPT16512.1 hypothetical protein CYQ11_12280 [Streptomyces cinnamoneus]
MHTATAQSPKPFETVYESYAFACMRCAHAWEQSYEIRHHVDAEGQPFVTYYADDKRVPSPLTRPTCENCGEHVVRIMRPGQVSVVADALHLPKPSVFPQATTGPLQNGGSHEPHPRHHWHLSDLLKPFHRK